MRPILFAAALLLAGTAAAQQPADLSQSGLVGPLENPTIVTDTAQWPKAFQEAPALTELVRAGKSVVVLEARNRVGGRVINHDLGGGAISERGGTFVGPTQDRVLALMDAYGISKFDTYDPNGSKNVYYNPQGQRYEWSDTGPTGTAPSDPLITPDLATVVTQLDNMIDELRACQDYVRELVSDVE